MIIIVLAALCLIAIGGGTIIVEAIVIVGGATPMESLVRLILPGQPVWLTGLVAVVLGAALIAGGIVVLLSAHRNDAG